MILLLLTISLYLLVVGNFAIHLWYMLVTRSVILRALALVSVIGTFMALVFLLHAVEAAKDILSKPTESHSVVLQTL